MNNPTPCFARILFAAHPEQDIQVALRRAVFLAERLKAELHVLRVLTGRRAAEPETQTGAELRKAKEELSELLPAGDVMELSVCWEVRLGEAAEEIIAYARQAAVDLIVLGSRNRSGLSRFFSGSVADNVYRLAPCPLLTVPLEMEDGCDHSEQEEASQKWDATALGEGGPAAPAYDLLLRAMSLRATDIHIDPAAPDEFAVRFRIDGKVQADVSEAGKPRPEIPHPPTPFPERPSRATRLAVRRGRATLRRPGPSPIRPSPSRRKAAVHRGEEKSMRPEKDKLRHFLLTAGVEGNERRRTNPAGRPDLSGHEFQGAALMLPGDERKRREQQ